MTTIKFKITYVAHTVFDSSARKPNSAAYLSCIFVEVA